MVQKMWYVIQYSIDGTENVDVIQYSIVYGYGTENVDVIQYSNGTENVDVIQYSNGTENVQM